MSGHQILPSTLPVGVTPRPIRGCSGVLGCVHLSCSLVQGVGLQFH